MITFLPKGAWYQGHDLVSSTWSASQVSLAYLSTCVKGRTPEKVLASWAVATSTALLTFSGFPNV